MFSFKLKYQIECIFDEKGWHRKPILTAGLFSYLFKKIKYCWFCGQKYTSTLETWQPILPKFTSSIAYHIRIFRVTVFTFWAEKKLNSALFEIYTCNELIRSNFGSTNHVFTNFLNKYYVICILTCSWH